MGPPQGGCLRERGRAEGVASVDVAARKTVKVVAADETPGEAAVGASFRRRQQDSHQRRFLYEHGYMDTYWGDGAMCKASEGENESDFPP